eukprot:Nitzschia sp. Nitz4//scaffold337_size18511//2857//4623//NITZ4_008779-RA/size18511-processed-gene-0.7-mRNA-1//-1//CDS//3329548307//7845//frame0
MRRTYSSISQHPAPQGNGQMGYPYFPQYAYPMGHPPQQMLTPAPPHVLFYYPFPYDQSQYRKKQRRQAAADVVESIWNNDNNNGRKSTAQPRPQITVPPRGIGPIVDPNNNDVLCGRGGRINSHTGNVQFRDIINSKKKEYLAPSTKKLEKAHIAAAIVYDIRAMDPPGRFLKEDRDTGLWFDIGDVKAIKKTGQALREDAPDIRPELEDGDSSGDDKAAASSKETPPKKEEAKPKAAPKPKAPPKAKMAAQMTPTSQPQMSFAQDFQSIPIPHQANPYIQQQKQTTHMQSGYIPIQSPMPQAVYSLPNKLVTGASHMGRQVGQASRRAFDALSQAGGQSVERMSGDVPPDNVAFGRPFHPPSGTVLSSDNTMSTISGISDPISSAMGASAVMSDFVKGSAISGLSNPSGISGIEGSIFSNTGSARGTFRDNSVRFSQNGLGVSGMGQSSRNHFLEAMNVRGNRTSDATTSMRSLGSLGRSMSFNDMNSLADDGTWRTIMEDEEMFNTSQIGGQSLLSGELLPGAGRGQRVSSAMSVTSMSTASSARWLAGLKDTTMGDDNRSVLSEMSSELHALDLAARRPSDGFHR